MAEQYRIATLGHPRSEWRSSPARAMADAVALDLASWDASKREWYLAVPVTMERRGRPDLPRSPYPKRRPRLREPWTEADIARLRTIARRGGDVLMAQVYLGRSAPAIRRKAAALGIRFTRTPDRRRTAST